MPDIGRDGINVSTEVRGDAVLVSPQGEVDLTASPVLREALRRVQANRPGRLIVDLGQVPYMDSSGVATLVEAMQIARRNNTRMFLASMTERVRSIFEIARLDTVFTICASTDEALAK